MNICRMCGQRVRVTSKGKARAHTVSAVDGVRRCHGTGSLAQEVDPSRPMTVANLGSPTGRINVYDVKR